MQVWNFSQTIRRANRKINKDIKELKNTGYKFELKDIFRTLYSTTVGYTLFSSTYRAFTINHIVNDKHTLTNYIGLKSYGLYPQKTM